MCNTTVDFRQGDRYRDIVFLGACPGQVENDALPQRPFAGQSGRNLVPLLTVLNAIPENHIDGLRAEDFPSIRPDDYTLMNSHPESKWRGRDRRSTPRMSEVRNPMNIQRLSNQLQAMNARVVIGLGRPLADADLQRAAKDSGPLRAIRLLTPRFERVAFFVVGHPSPVAINIHGNADAELWFRNGLHGFP
jgi:uracil-DNA glycosylase